MFKCYESLHDTVWNSELGSSVAIFKAGYTIDSLMLKYQGADWTNLDNWNCNAGCAHKLSCLACVQQVFPVVPTKATATTTCKDVDSICLGGNLVTYLHSSTPCRNGCILGVACHCLVPNGVCSVTNAGPHCMNLMQMHRVVWNERSHHAERAV